MSSLQSPANPLCLPQVHWLRLPQTHLPVKLTTVMVHSSIPCPGPSHSQHSPLFFHHSPINPLWLKNSLTWYSSNQLHFKIITEILAFPRWCKRCGFDLWVRKIPWRIPRTEEPDGLQSMGLQSQTQLSMHVTLKSYVATVADTVRITERKSFTP